MSALIDSFILNSTTGQLLFAYFWAILFPACGLAWAIESVCLRVFRKDRANEWRNL